jgi:hypothetical protein
MYYPDQRYASSFTVIRRECLLPEDAIGTVRITEGKRVDIRDVVASGVLPSCHVVLEAASYFGLRKPEALDGLMLVEPGDVVEERQVLAGKNPNRGKRLLAPFKAVVAQVENGRIILQEMPELINLEAGVRGRVVRVHPGRGVVVEAEGALVQGVWGNNRHTIATLRLEPDGGLAGVVSDALDMRYSGALVVTRSPLTMRGLEVMEEHSFSGVIAPSMDSSLGLAALDTTRVILLTEGFGNMRMSVAVFNMLVELEGHQATIDARMSSRWESRFPELVINISGKEGQRPSLPNVMLSLREGMTVRVTREPFVGYTGRVLHLPKTPILLDNGLRVPCAQVELVAGETIVVPLANLEVLGR